MTSEDDHEDVAAAAEAAEHEVHPNSGETPVAHSHSGEHHVGYRVEKPFVSFSLFPEKNDPIVFSFKVPPLPSSRTSPSPSALQEVLLQGHLFLLIWYGKINICTICSSFDIFRASLPDTNVEPPADSRLDSAPERRRDSKSESRRSDCDYALNL